MVEVGDRVLVESEKVGSATRSGQHSCWSLRTVRREVLGSSAWALRTSPAVASQVVMSTAVALDGPGDCSEAPASCGQPCAREGLPGVRPGQAGGHECALV